MDPDADRTSDADVDALVRRALEPERSTVDHVVAHALDAGRGPAARRLTRQIRHLNWALASAAVVLVVGIALGTTFWQRGPEPPPTGIGTVTNEGDIIVIIAPDRPITLIGSASANPAPPPGTASIVLLGEPK